MVSSFVSRVLFILNSTQQWKCEGISFHVQSKDIHAIRGALLVTLYEFSLNPQYKFKGGLGHSNIQMALQLPAKPAHSHKIQMTRKIKSGSTRNKRRKTEMK